MLTMHRPPPACACVRFPLVLATALSGHVLQRALQLSTAAPQVKPDAHWLPHVITQCALCSNMCIHSARRAGPSHASGRFSKGRRRDVATAGLHGLHGQGLEPATASGCHTGLIYHTSPPHPCWEGICDTIVLESAPDVGW